MLAEKGIRVLARDSDLMRIVFHRDITDEMLAEAIEGFKQVLIPT